MRTTTYNPTCCDACGHVYGEREKMGLMRFRSDNANFEASYTVCLTCLPRIPADVDRTNRALTRAMERAPELLAYANVGGEA